MSYTPAAHKEGSLQRHLIIGAIAMAIIGLGFMASGSIANASDSKACVYSPQWNYDANSDASCGGPGTGGGGGGGVVTDGVSRDFQRQTDMQNAAYREYQRAERERARAEARAAKAAREAEARAQAERERQRLAAEAEAEKLRIAQEQNKRTCSTANCFTPGNAPQPDPEPVCRSVTRRVPLGAGLGWITTTEVVCQ